jgi:3'(2'), 5'-bisphosphate nucleotidase
MEWDTAAAHCFVQEAVGVVCDGSGESLRYNRADLHNSPFAVLAAADSKLRELLRGWKW